MSGDPSGPGPTPGAALSPRSLDAVFSPRSVAVVGASRTRGHIGSELLHNLRSAGFTGRLAAVNPHASDIDGVPSFPTLADVPGPLDLAVLAVPAPDIPAAVAASIAAGVGGIIVITAGFRETGPAGAAAEAALVATVRAAGVRMIGPNCMGVVNTDPAVGLNATFASAFPPRGRVAFLSQSGALGLAILQYAARLNIGISTFVSVGNAADVSNNDLIAYWADDPRTSVILLYLESVGNPRTFARLVAALTPRKPVVLVKAGRSRAGARAARSHTGALASGDAVVDAMCRQTGVIRVESLEELFGVATLLANQPLPRGKRVAVLTNAGGPGIMATDAVEAEGLEMATLTGETTAALTALCPAEASVGNPVDLLAAAPPERYARALALLLDDVNVDSVLVVYTPPLVTHSVDVAQAVRDVVAAHPGGKTVLATFLDVAGVPDALGAIPSFPFPEGAVAALAHACTYGAWRAQPRQVPERPADCDTGRARVVLRTVLDTGREWLTAAEVAEVLAAAGVPALGVEPVTAATLVAVADRLRYPLVLKAVGESLLHKTESGGVVLDLRTREELLAAYGDLQARLGARMEGALLQPYTRGGVEMLIGAAVDPGFGPVVTCGLGGTRVELMRDVAMRLAPVAPQDARELLAGLKGAALLAGYRGAPPVALDALADAVCRVSWLAADCPELAELDLNPVLATAGGAVALDARLRVARSDTGRAGARVRRPSLA